jgi:hypothetical protein
MIYHVPSWVGWMLAARRSINRRSLRAFSARQAIFELLESPGTKAYTLAEATQLAKDAGFTEITARAKLGPGDLLMIQPSRRYTSKYVRLAWKAYPRPIVRLLGDRFGLNLLLTARKAT